MLLYDREPVSITPLLWTNWNATIIFPSGYEADPDEAEVRVTGWSRRQIVSLV